MRDWPALPPDDELERADDLLNQADALLRRHHMAERPPPDTAPDWTPGTELEDEDLPILTEVVDEFDLPQPQPLTSPHYATGFEHPPPLQPERAAATATPSPTPLPLPTNAALQDALSVRLAERLVELDTEIAREIGNWVTAEMPQIIARELDQLADRLQTEMHAHLRATLLPELSERIGRLLDKPAPSAVKPEQARPPS